jgi:hypothetical protein
MRRLALASVATTTVEWDLSKLTTRIKNKLIKWFDTGVRTNNGGQAASIFLSLSKQLGIPSIKVSNGWVQWENVPDYLLAELEKVRTVSATIYRMKNEYVPWWGRMELTCTDGWFSVEEGVNLDDLYKAVAQMNEGYKPLADKAKEFIQSGQKLQFVY